MAKKCGYVALAGRPNVGKSTLLNHLLGEKVAIVSDKPQTTRNRILGVYHGDDLQIGFLDLPGVHKPQHKMNRLMMRDVHQGLADADVVLHMIDVTQSLGSGDTFVGKLIQEKELPVILVANKLDLINKSKVIPMLEKLYATFQPKELVPISALKGENVDKLISLLANYLPEGDFIFDEDMLTDCPTRFLVQEFIREKILHYTREELPHAAAVTIESWEEEDGVIFLGAVIWVERATQRKIILGSGGQMISKIRQGAKRSLKQLLAQPFELELFVKVSKNWRDEKRFVEEQLGYKTPGSET